MPENQMLYRDPSQPLDARVEDLLSRMTLAEKIGQLIQLDGHRNDLDDLIHRMHVGSLLHIQNEELAVAIDKAAQSRLNIPILFGDDCIHGHSFHHGATIFSTQLGMACSWNSQLIEEAARITAKEVRLTGLKWTFSPVLCLTRDLRWGRVGETFGEDPFLIGEFACAMIRGYQGKGLDDDEAILATAKHYAGYLETQGGRDASEADLTQEPLFAFGEGLGYTSFEYDNLNVLTPKVGLEDTVRCSVALRNTGDREGVEVAQLYVSDLVTSATWVNKELKAFQRVLLKPGEIREVTFEVPVRELSIVNAAGERVVEPGEFELQVGKSSRDRDLLKAGFQVVAK